MNIAALPDLLKITQKWEVTIDLQLLFEPAPLNIRHMPDEFKTMMIEKLILWVDQPGKETLTSGLNAVINRLKEPRDESKWQEAKAIIKGYDGIRPFTLASVSPDLAPYLA